MDEVVRHASVETLLEVSKPVSPVLCLRPEILRARAATFCRLFPGRVLYAMKCNPHPLVLDALAAGGVNDFDTASLAEMETVSRLLPGARSYFHHPVKSREAIRRAYDDYGVRHFVVDHPSELEKLVATVGQGDIVVHVRLATPQTLASFNLSAKFGAAPESTVDLLRRIDALGLPAGITFHVGSLCRTVEAFTVALHLVGEVLATAGVGIRFLNVGGGFPVDYPGLAAPPLEGYIRAIESGVRALALPADCELLAEPGRALVAEGASLVVQVQMRRDDRLYINDGVYGSLMDLRLTEGLNPPVRLRRPGSAMSEDCDDFTIFGPTCDSIDVLPLPWRLPKDAGEGDWIEVGLMGAYSNVFATDFNGLTAPQVAEVADAPFQAMAA